jgi:DNA-binding beta-propeller fold protein YncE
MRFLLALLISLVSLTGALATEIKGDWKFPSDIAVDGGRLYVVDGLNDRIAVYNLYGEHIGDIKVRAPFGIYVEKGLLYVTNQKGKLYVMDEYGNIEKELTLQGRPIDVVKVGDRLFVTNGETNTIDVYSLNGELLKRLAGKGSAPGQFVGIFLLDRSENLIFVVDTINAKIQEFDLKGQFVDSFGTFGVEEGDLFRPKGVAYCNGVVVVSDCITGALQAFNTYGGFLGVVARDLYYPTALACSEGEVFVLEPLKGKVSTYRIQGVK